MGWKRSALALAMTTIAISACSDNGTDVSVDQQAVVVGRVDQTAPEGSAYPVARDVVSGASSQATAKTVVVGRLGADGSLNTLADADVESDGSFRVDNVPAGEDHLAVVARDDAGAAVGRAMVYGATSAGESTTATPITYETTVETLAWAQLVSDGNADATSREEMTLLLRPDASASATLLANGELQAAAEGAAMASETLSKVFAQAGSPLDASARADLMSDAAVHFAQVRYQGTTSADAYDMYLDAALDGFVGAGVSLEDIAMASAAAATTFDADVKGRSSVRGQLVSEAVRMNLRARERLAARFDTTDQGVLAMSLADILASTDASVRGSATAADIRTALDAGSAAAADATVDTVVNLLVPDATAVLRDAVAVKAQAVVDAARLDARLSATTNADAAAQAMASYRSQVHAAVAAMLEVAGRTDVDADTMTSLYIAAHGGAYIHTS